jgi:hypothetical protein
MRRRIRRWGGKEKVAFLASRPFPSKNVESNQKLFIPVDQLHRFLIVSTNLMSIDRYVIKAMENTGESIYKNQL